MFLSSWKFFSRAYLPLGMQFVSLYSFKLFFLKIYILIARSILVKRMKKLKCCKSEAMVSSAVQKWRKNYHFPLGFEFQMLNKYFMANTCCFFNLYSAQKTPMVTRNGQGTFVVSREEVPIYRLSPFISVPPSVSGTLHCPCVLKDLPMIVSDFCNKFV